MVAEGCFLRDPRSLLRSVEAKSALSYFHPNGDSCRFAKMDLNLQGRRCLTRRF